jgi:excinuclease ABC subunit B
LQLRYNAEHNITPESVKSAINMGIEDEIAAHKLAAEAAGQRAEDFVTQEYLEELHHKMLEEAANQHYEEAAKYRDLIAKLKGEPTMSPQVKKPRGRRRGRAENR